MNPGAGAATPGAELAERYHREVVAPLLADRWPRLPHAAARLGGGSDVLGLDDELSLDHDFGLRLTLLVPAEQVDEVDAHLERELPAAWSGWPVRFATTWDPVVRQRVDVATAESFVASRLGLNVSAEWSGPTVVDWLCLTGQSVLEVTAGPVFVDTDGALTRIRDRLAWYPDGVWPYVVAADWTRLAEGIHLLGRAGQRGDELGSRVQTGRLVGVAMHLAFLLTRRWPPYEKWLGTLFGALPVAGELGPLLEVVLSAADWREREAGLVAALDVLHRAQRRAGLPTEGEGATERFHDRPYVGVRARLIEVLLDDVADEEVRRLPVGVGSVEQWVDNPKVLSSPERRVLVARRLLAG